MNLAHTIIPKSDQLNADDLISGPITIKVTSVKGTGDKDVPVAIHYEGDNGKPYKPCKSMRRVLVSAWGDNDKGEYVGRSMTLYRDNDVSFGGIKVGGIRISHLSHIEKDLTLALTVSRASRKPYTVKRLDVATPVTDVAALAAIDAANTLDELVNVWKSLTKEEQKMPTVIAAKDAKKVELTPKTETE
jgi:cell division protein ZapA (FtsZ GTPase activity inhibitor)